MKLFLITRSIQFIPRNSIDCCGQHNSVCFVFLATKFMIDRLLLKTATSFSYFKTRYFIGEYYELM